MLQICSKQFVGSGCYRMTDVLQVRIDATFTAIPVCPYYQNRVACLQIQNNLLLWTTAHFVLHLSPFIITDFEGSEERFFHVIPCFFFKVCFFFWGFFFPSYLLVIIIEPKIGPEKRKYTFGYYRISTLLSRVLFWASDNRFEIALSDNPIFGFSVSITMGLTLHSFTAQRSYFL